MLNVNVSKCKNVFKLVSITLLKLRVRVTVITSKNILLTTWNVGNFLLLVFQFPAMFWTLHKNISKVFCAISEVRNQYFKIGAISKFLHAFWKYQLVYVIQNYVNAIILISIFSEISWYPNKQTPLWFAQMETCISIMTLMYLQFRRVQKYSSVL